MPIKPVMFLFHRRKFAPLFGREVGRNLQMRFRECLTDTARALAPDPLQFARALVNDWRDLRQLIRSQSKLAAQSLSHMTRQ